MIPVPSAKFDDHTDSIPILFVPHWAGYNGSFGTSNAFTTPSCSTYRTLGFFDIASIKVSSAFAGTLTTNALI